MHVKNKYNDSTTTRDICNLSFPRTFDKPKHVWPHPTNFAWLNSSFQEYLI